jgi:hypothetical protein
MPHAWCPRLIAKLLLLWTSSPPTSAADHRVLHTKEWNPFAPRLLAHFPAEALHGEGSRHSESTHDGTFQARLEKVL